MQTHYIIGDIHGDYQELLDLVAKLPKDVNLIFVGDLIDRVFLTGGSTLVPAVRDIYTEFFTEDEIIHTDVFSSVGYGLAVYSGEVFESRKVLDSV